MPYARRDPDGRIEALFSEPQEGAEEFLTPDNPDLEAFLAGGDAEPDDSAVYLSATDTALARVLEDLIELLVQKGVLLYTELPGDAQRKLSRRRRIREHLGGVHPLLPEDDDIL
ncbi:MAG TPA: hypothetical protein VKA64_02550 [Gammaproteobacteria bacterium]|nr:hypothetical protein [Gammaproteobacteria bacterium]